ncbi:MAG: AAA family ATPase, partial [Desulfomonile tiedjei]|nr:AAA family ATPase [Desulfomonile tiedjei]
MIPRQLPRHDFFPEPLSGSAKPLSYYLRHILEKKLTLVAFFIVIFAGSIIFGLTRVPQYRSSASLRMELGTPSGRGIVGSGESEPDFNFFYATQIQAMKEMADGAWAPSGMPRGAAGEPMADGLDQQSPWRGLQVNATRGSRLIDLEVTAEDPFIAREKLQLYIREYIEADRHRKEEFVNSLLSKLRLEVKHAEERMLRSQKELVDFSKEHAKVFLDENPDLAFTFLDTATQKLMDSRNERLDLETLSMHRQMILPRNIDSQYMRKLRDSSASLKGEYISASSALGPGHFQLALYESKIYALEKAIADLEKSEFNNTLEAARRKESASLDLLERAKREAIRSGSLAIHFEVLKKAAQADADVYFNLCERVRDASLFIQLAPHSVHVEDPPSLTSNPVTPNWTKILVAGLLLGLGSGLSAVFIRVFLDNRIRSAQELKTRLNLPVLGVVPNVRLVMPRGLETVSDIRYEFLPFQFPVSPFTDSIRVVRESVAGMLERDTGMVLAVTSALPCDGKTFISMALASAVASERKRVLVLDADLRNPRIGRVLEAPLEHPGLTNILTGKADRLDEVIHASHVPGLFFVMSGAVPENPVALLRSQTMREFIRNCNKSFDMVIIDCPPVLGFADA